MKKTYIVVASSIMLLFCLAYQGAYAYFTTNSQMTGDFNTDISSGTISDLIISDGNHVTSNNIIPGESVTNTFTVQNPNNLKVCFNLLWSDVVNEFINKANEFLDKKQKDKISSIAGFLAILERLLGVGGKNPFEYFQLGVSEEQKQEIENLIAQRTEAKKQKDFTKADEIRERLHSIGIEIMDLPTKSVWEKV